MEKTLLLIKPDAVERNLIGKIIDRLETTGFRVAQLRMLQLTAADAGAFYKVHEGKPFLNELVSFMSSNPIVAMMLEKENAVADLRELIGATDPSKAAYGTIRQCFAVDVTRNSVHASDSVENAAIELGFFFKD